VLDWLAENLALIMFVSMFFVIFCGYPVAFIMGGMALLFALAGWFLGVFSIIGIYDVVLRMWGGVAADPVLASIPMFIFMGTILERSGSAMDMLRGTEAPPKTERASAGDTARIPRSEKTVCWLSAKAMPPSAEPV